MPRAQERLSAELFTVREIEIETKRVIADHLPTIYATRSRTGDRFLDPIPPNQIESHIRHFFSEADEAILAAGKLSRSPSEIVHQFQLFFRQLYTVAQIETQLGAIENGRTEALKLTSGCEEQIEYLFVHSASGNLFSRCAAINSGHKGSIGVVVVIDDVAHSGSQMGYAFDRAKRTYPGRPVVVSVGVITERAKEYIQRSMDRDFDKLLYVENRFSLKEMIEAVPGRKRRNELTKLAETFFTEQRNFDFTISVRATHIITPFKLPDTTSNGPLALILNNDRVTTFIPSRALTPNRLYPTVL